MRDDILRIFETPEFGAAGTDPAYPRSLIEVGVNPRVRYSLDGRDQLIFTVPDTADMRELVTARKVVRLTPPDEPTSEWLISRTTQTAGPAGNGLMQVECDPIRVVLADAGILEFVETGGKSYVNLGGINGSINNYLATYVIPHLTRRGYTWIEIGQIDSTAQFSYSWDSFTATQLIEALAKEVGAEWRLRRDDINNNYKIDIVEKIGDTISDIEAKEGLNILQLVRQRNRERLFTSIRPAGLLAEGEEERASIAYNAWRVTNVSGDNVVVVPHQGGFGAILENGQHVGLYLQAANGTFHEIKTSTESTQTFGLETGSGASFSVNDDVSIVADNQGTLLTSIESPSGIAQSGFVQGQIVSTHAGHRNWIRNPTLAVWPDRPRTSTARIDGGQTGTTINLKNLPPNFPVFANDYFIISGIWRRITANATSDGSGNITVVFATSGGYSDNLAAWYVEATKHFPSPWAGVAFGNALPRGAAITQSCQAAALTVASETISVKSLPPNFVIPSGTHVGAVSGAGVLLPGSMVYTDAVADGSGNVILQVKPITPGTISNNQSLVLRRPEISGVGFVSGGVLAPEGTQTMRQNVYIRTLGSGEPITFSARFRVYDRQGGSNWPSNAIEPFVILQTSTGTTIQVGDPADLSSGGDNFALRSSVPFVTRTVASGEYRFVVVPPTAATIQTINMTWFLESTQLVLGDMPLPFVEGSEATRIFQDAQIGLIASRQWPATYTVRLSKIVSEWGLDPNSPALDLGSFLRIRSPSVGVDAIFRIIAIEFDPSDPSDKVFTLDSDPVRISALTAKARPRPVFVDINVEVKDGRARETVLVSDAPPVAAPGAERFVVSSGAVAPVGALPVEPLPDDFLL